MRHAITIRLDPELEKLLTRLPMQTGRSRSDLVCKALRRQLSLLGFEALRRQALPFAEARGYLTDEDVARDISGMMSPPETPRGGRVKPTDPGAPPGSAIIGACSSWGSTSAAPSPISPRSTSRPAAPS
ncbi:MAG: ribbon-helix-helix protein, CopG family [Candidatus Rokubacteria bacterium]|nr:ribbon-helix-helix protein, CopG family [Candidatus Rokubacteria bacterium]